VRRRDFLKGSILGSASFALPTRALWAQSSDARIEILLDEPLGVISPNLYGHFTEHIGGVIYDGVWVGPNSKIPNKFGIRNALVDRLKEIAVPIIRWPGGCFADSYDWKDGVGPRASRPKRTNFWETEPDAARLHLKGLQVFEPNSFGTNEFIQFCRLSGAEPYIAANIRSLSAMDFDRWVEYCNAPAGSTTLADLRSAAGFSDPFRVRYWGVGNESWGCGGNFRPEDYASEFRRFTTWVPGYGVDLQFIGSGPNGNDIDWTHRFFEQLHSGHEYNNPSFIGWSVHHYAWNLSRGKTQDWIAAKGDALLFDSTDWYELLRESNRIEQIIFDQWATLGQYDLSHHIKLVIDEYGSWYREGSELDPTHIFGQQITMRDALATALTLDTFNRNPEKVGMGNCAQLVNNLNALFLAHEDRFIVTPNFHVFAMYSSHQGARALRTEFSAPDVHYLRNGQPASFWGLRGSASLNQNVITLTVVNPDLAGPKLTQIKVAGARVKNVSADVLVSADVHAHNTFEQPDTVRRHKLDVSGLADLLTSSIPAASVARLEITVE
jgi:alpha-L-arabinofuranosidase